MSLIILANDFPPSTGGIQRYLYELAGALHRRGAELLVIAPDQPGAEAFDAASSLPTVRVASGSRRQTAQVLAEAAIKRIRAAEPAAPVSAIIAGNWWPDGYAAWLVRRRVGVPYVVMGYGREMVQTGVNLGNWRMQNLIIRGAAGGLGISDYAANQLSRRGLPLSRVEVIYGGVDPGLFPADDNEVAQLQAQLNPKGEPVLLTVSRLVQRKGHSQVIAALPQVIEQVGPVRYLIVGTGPEEQGLRARAEGCGVAELVEFLGQVDDQYLAALYRVGDLFIMPSRDLYGQPIEGLGLVYLEANLCGLPIIASNTGGIPDAVLHGETGLLVNPEDPSEIAAAIVHLITDKDLAARLGAAGRARVLGEFTWDRVAERCWAALAEWDLAGESRPEAS